MELDSTTPPPLARGCVSCIETPLSEGNASLKFAQDLVASVVHVLDYRKELKGWNTRNSSAGAKALASRLTSELKVSGELQDVCGGAFPSAVIDSRPCT